MTERKDGADNPSPSKKRQKAMTIAAIVVAAALISTYALVSSQVPTVDGGQQEKEKRIIQGGWNNYATLKDLYGNSTDIVVGEVIDVKGKVEEALPKTDYNFRVDNVVKGSLAADKIIAIRQAGGESDAYITEVESDPLFKQGEKFLAFMRYSSENDVYVILGGPQGRFPVQDNVINSMDTVHPEADWISVKVQNKELGQFVQEIQEARDK